MRLTTDDGQWCRLEIMGHREHIGRAKEVPLLTGKALRICDETEEHPLEYGLCAIFRITWLPDVDGEKANATWVAEHEAQKNRRAHSLKIGAIQRTIIGVLGGEKLSYEAIEVRVGLATPHVNREDFNEALKNLGLDRWAIPDGELLYWRDPDSIPF